jgi:hypothetical protein
MVPPLKETVQSVQQFVCVFPFTVPVKHESLPPSALPGASVPLEPDRTK